MRLLLTSALLLLLASCAGRRGYTGYASQDLQGVIILLQPQSEARIEGEPRYGSPVDFARHLVTPGITLLEMSFLQEDSTEIPELLENAPFPIVFHYGEPRVVIHLEGMHWELRVHPGEKTTGTALIHNLTGETWTAEQVELADGSRVLARSSGSVSIPPEGAIFPWWEKESAPPETLLVYNYPTPGRWNPVIALPMRQSPPAPPAGFPGALRNDTLWLPADHLLRTDLSWTRRSNGYQCVLHLESTSEIPIQWKIILPARLPRGALTEPGEGFASTVILPPGATTQIRYSEIYPRGT